MSTVAGNPAIDPTITFTPLTLDGTTYNLVFTYRALAIAEAKLREAGTPISMLRALDFSAITATALAPLLYAAAITAQPDITIEQVTSLVTMRHWEKILINLASAYIDSLADPKKAETEDAPSDPTTPES